MHPVLNGKNNVFSLKKMWKYRKLQRRKKKEKEWGVGGGGGGGEEETTAQENHTIYVVYFLLPAYLPHPSFFSAHSALNTHTVQFCIFLFKIKFISILFINSFGKYHKKWLSHLSSCVKMKM